MTEDEAGRLIEQLADVSDARLGEIWLFNATAAASSGPDSVFRRLKGAVLDEAIRRGHGTRGGH